LHNPFALHSPKATHLLHTNLLRQIALYHLFLCQIHPYQFLDVRSPVIKCLREMHPCNFALRQIALYQIITSDALLSNLNVRPTASTFLRLIKPSTQIIVYVTSTFITILRLIIPYNFFSGTPDHTFSNVYVRYNPVIFWNQVSKWCVLFRFRRCLMGSITLCI